MARYTVNLGFNIDTANLNKAIQEIRTKLRELNLNSQLNGEFVSGRTKNTYIQQLTALRELIQSSTRIDDTDFERSLAHRVDLINSFHNRTIDAISQPSHYEDSFINQLTLREKAMERFNGLTNKLGDRIISFFKVTSMVNEVTKMTNFLTQLDDALTEISTVTGASLADLKQYAREYNQLAQELGRSTTDIAKSAVEFYRQGRTQDETMDLLRATMIGSKISGEAPTSTAETLTSTINGFQLLSDQAMDIVSKFSALDANMATSFAEMSTAMKRVASSAKITEVKIFELLKNLRKIISSYFKNSSTTNQFLLGYNI